MIFPVILSKENDIDQNDIVYYCALSCQSSLDEIEHFLTKFLTAKHQLTTVTVTIFLQSNM
jgi:hypothetical protein